MDSPSIIAVHSAALANARHVVSTCSHNHHLLTGLILAQHLSRLPQIEQLDQQFIERGYLNRNPDAVGLLRCVCNLLNDCVAPGPNGVLPNISLFTPNHRSYNAFHQTAVSFIDASANDVSVISTLSLLSISSDAFAFNELFHASMRHAPWALGSFLEDMHNARNSSLVFAFYNSWVFSFNSTAPFSEVIRTIESLVLQATNAVLEEE